MERIIIIISLAVLITSIVIGWSAINISNQTNKLLQEMREILNKQLEIEHHSPLFKTSGRELSVKPSYNQPGFSFQDTISINYESGHIIEFSIINATLEPREDRIKCIFEKEPKINFLGFVPIHRGEESGTNEEKFIVIFSLDDFKFKIPSAFEDFDNYDDSASIRIGNVIYEIEAFDIQSKETYSLNATTRLYVITVDSLVDMVTSC